MFDIQDHVTPKHYYYLDSSGIVQSCVAGRVHDKGKVASTCLEAW
jgi:hypothetical protein